MQGADQQPCRGSNAFISDTDIWCLRRVSGITLYRGNIYFFYIFPDTFHRQDHTADACAYGHKDWMIRNENATGFQISMLYTMFRHPMILVARTRPYHAALFVLFHLFIAPIGPWLLFCPRFICFCRVIIFVITILGILVE